MKFELLNASTWLFCSNLYLVFVMNRADFDVFFSSIVIFFGTNLRHTISWHIEFNLREIWREKNALNAFMTINKNDTELAKCGYRSILTVIMSMNIMIIVLFFDIIFVPLFTVFACHTFRQTDSLHQKRFNRVNDSFLRINDSYLWYDVARNEMKISKLIFYLVYCFYFSTANSNNIKNGTYTNKITSCPEILLRRKWKKKRFKTISFLSDRIRMYTSQLLITIRYWTNWSWQSSHITQLYTFVFCFTNVIYFYHRQFFSPTIFVFSSSSLCSNLKNKYLAPRKLEHTIYWEYRCSSAIAYQFRLLLPDNTFTKRQFRLY